MKVSIIIAAYKEKDNLAELIPSLYKHNVVPRAEVIIADSSTDDSNKLLKKYEEIQFYRSNKQLFPGEARNLGIKKATGDALAFIDADTIMLDGWYEAAVNDMKKHDIVAGAAPSLPGQKKRLPRVSIWINGQDITWPTCNIIYKKKVIDDVGIFQEGMPSGADVELNYRCAKAGYKIHYDANMRLYHKHRSTWRGFMKQSFRDGYVRAQLEALHPDIKSKHKFGMPTPRNIVRLGCGAVGYAKKRMFSAETLDTQR